MASNNKTHEKKIKKIEYSIKNDSKIIEAVRKGGELELRLKGHNIEFYRKEKDKGRELVSTLEKISDIKCLRWYVDIVLDLMGEHWDSNPYYKVSLKTTYNHKEPQKKQKI